MLLSRGFPTEFGDATALVQSSERLWGEPKALVPVADLINHDRSCSSTFTIESAGVPSDGEGEACVVFRNTDPREVGEEAFINYGADKSNEELLVAFGFADDDNTADAVALMISSDGGPGRRCLIGRTGITQELWDTLLAGAGNAESLALKILKSALDAKLGAIRDSEPSPEAYAAAMKGRAESVRRYRRGVVDILQGASEECAALAQLDLASSDDDEPTSESGTQAEH